MTSNFDMRMVFENAKTALIKAFPDASTVNPNLTVGQIIVDQCKLTQSDYRFEVPLAVGATNFQFNVLKNEPNLIGNNNSTETRLKQQDSAVIYELGLFLGAPASINDNTFTLDTYPSPTKYGVNAVPYNAIYNGGNLSIKVNNDVVVPNWDTWKHYNSNQTQATAAPGAGSPIDQVRGSFDGFFPMEPNVTLIGSKDNVIRVDIPLGLASIQAFSRLICMVRCIVAQNSTVVS